MPAGCRVDRIALPVAETELQACLRRYKNDALIAWHLDMTVEQVRAARASYKPQRRIGTYAGGRGNSNDLEYERRKAAAARSNDAFLAAIGRLR